MKILFVLLFVAAVAAIAYFERPHQAEGTPRVKIADETPSEKLSAVTPPRSVIKPVTPPATPSASKEPVTPPSERPLARFNRASIVHSTAAAVGKVASAEETLEEWGLVSDPANDCDFEVEGDALTISIGESENPHDLSGDTGSLTAPCVLQSVAGDFVMQVRVDGEFDPGAKSTQAGRSGYNGAGLVVFADEQNFVRIERATFQNEGQDPVPYTNFEIRVNGKLETFGPMNDLPNDGLRPTWLRLERRGDQLYGAMSQDGMHWTYEAPKELVAEVWNQNELFGGVAAVSTSPKPFAPIYSDLMVEQGTSVPVDSENDKGQ